MQRAALTGALTLAALIVVSDDSRASVLSERVEQLLRQRCAQCHGGVSDPLSRPSGAEVFPAIGDLAKDKRRVVPGQPDMSPLFWAFFDGHGSSATGAPRGPDRLKATRRPGQTSGGPDPGVSVTQLREWIVALRAAKPVRPASVVGDVVVEGLPQRYARGDNISFRLRAKRDCRVTVVNVDTGGNATVVFPNDYAREAKIPAGIAVAVPGPDAIFQFRARKPGRERLVVFCAIGPGRLLGISHRFDVQRFTSLGNWEAFLARLPAASRQRAASRLRRGRQRAPLPDRAPFGAVSVVEFDIR